MKIVRNLCINPKYQWFSYSITGLLVEVYYVLKIFWNLMYPIFVFTFFYPSYIFWFLFVRNYIDCTKSIPRTCFVFSLRLFYIYIIFLKINWHSIRHFIICKFLKIKFITNFSMFFNMLACVYKGPTFFSFLFIFIIQIYIIENVIFCKSLKNNRSMNRFLLCSTSMILFIIFIQIYKTKTLSLSNNFRWLRYVLLRCK